MCGVKRIDEKTAIDIKSDAVLWFANINTIMVKQNTAISVSLNNDFAFLEYLRGKAWYGGTVVYGRIVSEKTDDVIHARILCLTENDGSSVCNISTNHCST